MADSEKLDYEIDRFRGALIKYGQNPPNGDLYFGNLAQAIHIETEPDGRLRPSVEDMFTLRRESMGGPVHPVNVAPNLVIRAIHKQALRGEGRSNYLHRFNPHRERAVGVWRAFIAQMSRPESDPREELDLDLAIRVIQSNIAYRGKGQKILMNAFPERFGGPQSLFEAGCALNLILKWLAVGRRSEITIYDENGDFSPEISRAANHMLASRVALRSCLGIDEWDFRDDKSVREWELACSVTPNDMETRPDLVEETYRLLSVDPKQVSFHKADFTNQNDMDSFPPAFIQGRRVPHSGKLPRQIPFPVSKFDGSFSSAASYQLSQEHREMLDAVLKDNTKESGIVSNLDFGRPDKSLPCGLKIIKNIYQSEYIFNFVFFDKQNPERGWQHGFTFRTGRCDEMVVGDGVIAVGGEEVSIKQRLLDSL
jgi:hypothetical protein